MTTRQEIARIDAMVNQLLTLVHDTRHQQIELYDNLIEHLRRGNVDVAIGVLERQSALLKRQVAN